MSTRTTETADPWLDIIQKSLAFGQLPENWPEEGESSSAWRKIVEDLVALRVFLSRLAEGDLSQKLTVKGMLAGNLKMLQSNLRHLTWQVQRVANGDLTQRVDFMGDFATAFNQMTESLRQAQQAERDQRALAEALRDTTAALNRAISLDDVFDSLLANIARVVPHDATVILTVQPDQSVTAVRHNGFDLSPSSSSVPLEHPAMSLANTPSLREMAETRLPCLIPDLHLVPGRFVPPGHWAQSHLGVPIIIKDHVAGFLVLLSRTKDFFSQENAIRLVSFADQAAIAIEKAQLIAQLNDMATKDFLTGVANRRHFFSLAEIEFERSIRYGHPISAMMLDIDHFKMVNDTYGHSAGDMVLQGVAHCCKQVLRKCDLVGRYGGEEFSMLLPETPLSAAYEAGERLRGEISARAYETPQGKVQVTASIGVSTLSPYILSVSTLLDRADKALYNAKANGRNQVKLLE